MSWKPLLANVTFWTMLAAFAAASGQEVPDIRTVEPDLVVPAMVERAHGPGKRVKQTTAGWEDTQVYHALYLPADWQPDKRYPVIVEYAGNGPFTSPYGDVSTGKVEGSSMGYGISGGKGVIWVCMPYLNNAGAKNVDMWWGDSPTYQVQPTIDYCIATVKTICERYGGDPAKVFLAGFSRGSIACNYIGLHNDPIASLWRGFICYANYDGLHALWPYPDDDRASAAKRLQRLGRRPQFICQEVVSNPQDALDVTRTYLNQACPDGNLTFELIPFRNHNDAWTLRDIPSRRALRKWFAEVLLASPAQAELPLHESFETEALGAFDGTANQTWTLGPATETIENKNLSYSGGDITVGSGDRALKISDLTTYASPVVHFDFATQSGPVYFSFLVQIEANAFFQPWVGYSAAGGTEAHFGSGQVYMDGRGFDDIVGTLAPVSGSGFLDTADLGNAKPAPVFVVVKLFKSGAAGDNYDRMQVVVNPTSATEPVTWNESLTKDIGVGSLDRFGLRYGNSAAGWIDEIRVGTTWVDVVPPALPPLSVAPGALFGDLTGLGANPGPQVQTVTISNDSSGAVDLGTPGITGADSGLYQVTSGPTQDPIPVGGTADIEVTFTPPAKDGSFQARLEIPTDRPEVAAVLVALDALVTAPPATLPLHESFETEALGAFDGTANQTWTLGPADETIEDKDLSYSGGDITVGSGTRVLKISNLAAYTSPVAHFDFATQSGPVYFSFLGQIAANAFFQPWVGYSAAGGTQAHFGSGQVYMDGRSEYGDGDQIVGTLAPVSGSGFMDTADLGNAIPAPVFVVVKLFKSGAAGDNYDRMQVVVNPTSATEPVTWNESLTKDIGVGSLDHFGLRYGNSAAGWIDEIRIGTSWAQVVPGASSAYETWAAANGAGADPAADSNRNGVADGIEFFMGGTVANPATLPPLVTVAGTVTWTIPYVPSVAATWRFQVSDDLTGWTDAPPGDEKTSILTAPDRIRLTLPAATTKKFCRLVVTPAP